MMTTTRQPPSTPLGGTQPALTDLIRLDRKVAVVTGAGAGIGRAIALRLAEAGARIVLADLDAPRVGTVRDEIMSNGGEATVAPLDVRGTAAITALAADVAGRLGRLDVWVNNAGIYPPVPVLDATEDDWDRMLDINLRAVFFASREAARHMMRGGHRGVVLNIASIAAHRAGPPGLTHYAASKAGVVAVTSNLAWAFGAQGIRVVGIAPGVVETDGMRAGLDQLTQIGANVAHRETRIALGRLGSGDDIARVALFLCSDLASFITGITIDVDGGDRLIGPSERPQPPDLGTL